MNTHNLLCDDFDRAAKNRQMVANKENITGYEQIELASELIPDMVIMRRKLKLSQHQLATILGVDPSTISRWERENRLPNIDDAAKIWAWMQR